MRHDDRLLRAFLPCLTFLLLIGCGPSPPSEPDHPNVLLYVVDTLRADALGSYGNSRVETPNIDALAAEGVVYENAFSASSWTRASIASLLSGQQPDVHGVQDRDDHATAEVGNLSLAFRAAGYRVGAIVTNPNVGTYFGFGEGFDHYIELFEHDETDLISETLDRARSDDATREAIEWIGRGAEPWLLFILVTDPHAPYRPPTGFDRYGLTPEEIKAARVGPGGKGRVRRLRKHRLYLGEVAFTDHALGQLFDHMRETGSMDDTLIALTADHGEHFGEHGRIGHGETLLQPVLHVPLLLRLPHGKHGGRRIDSAVQLVDLHATLRALAGVDPIDTPAPLPGDASVLPLESVPDRAAYSHLDLDGYRMEMIYEAPWKLVRPLPGANGLGPVEESLFDLSAAGEERPHAPADEPGVVARLRAQLEARARRRSEPTSAPLEPEASPSAVGDMPDDVRRALEHLGYIETEGTTKSTPETGATPPLPDGPPSS